MAAPVFGETGVVSQGLGAFTAFFQLILDFVADALNLARARPRCDHEKVGEGGHFPQVQHFDVGALFTVRGSHRRQPHGL